MENSIQIRKAEIDDAKTIAELHKKVVENVNFNLYSPLVITEWIKDISEENIRHQFHNSNWIVAEFDCTMVGFGQYSISDGEIYQINIDPGYLKQNIGKRLYEYMENDFKNKGKGKISLNSTLNAIEFYKKLGFVPVNDIHIGLVKMIKMKKFLRSKNLEETPLG